MKLLKDTTVNLLLLVIALIALLLATLSANGREIVVVPAPKRADVPPDIVYNICSPYTGYGELCVWHGGIEVPLLSTGPSQFRTMVTLIMPPANPNWDLYRGDFLINLDFVYMKDCKNNVVTYKNEAGIYKNEDVCN